MISANASLNLLQQIGSAPYFSLVPTTTTRTTVLDESNQAHSAHFFRALRYASYGVP